MSARTFPFDGPPYLGRGVRLFIVLALGPVCGCLLSAIANVASRAVAGVESPAAMIAGGLIGWAALAALMVAFGSRPTPGSVVIDAEKVVRTWRGIRQEMNFVDLARCELVPDQWVLLTDKAGKVLVVSAPGADLALVDQEIRARHRRDR